jgi:hypothetical protein
VNEHAATTSAPNAVLLRRTRQTQGCQLTRAPVVASFRPAKVSYSIAIPHCKGSSLGCRRQKRELSEPRSRTRPESAAAAAASGRAAPPAQQAAQHRQTSDGQGGKGGGGGGRRRDTDAGRDSKDGQDSCIDSRGRKRRRLRAPPLPDAHLVPDGRRLSQLSCAEAQALLEVRLPDIGHA